MRASKDKTKHQPGREMSPALIYALNHPARRQILRQLREHGTERSPSEMAQAATISLSGLSFHARVLSELQVTRCTRTEPVRGSLEHFYVSNVSENELVATILLETEGEDGGPGRR
ncbi:MAG TPA: helix-turn-helix domain-containing protein [Solirubrobacterales bacterium]|nr:helix-turn-helix domain-containing protein [Solirubrobacterales bacterium]